MIILNQLYDLLRSVSSIELLLCIRLMRLLRKYTWTPLNLWYWRCIVDEFLSISTQIIRELWHSRLYPNHIYSNRSNRSNRATTNRANRGCN